MIRPKTPVGRLGDPLDLLAFAPLILPARELAGLLSAFTDELLAQLATPAGRREFVASVAESLKREGTLTPEQRRYYTAIAGQMAVAASEGLGFGLW